MSKTKGKRFLVTRTMTIEVEVAEGERMMKPKAQAKLIAESCFDVDDDDERSRREDLPCDFYVGRAQGTVRAYSSAMTVTAVVEDSEPGPAATPDARRAT